MANMTFKASLLPNTNLGYSLGSETQNWKIYGAINSNATLDGSSFAIALQTYFNNNKTNIARNSLLTYYSSAYGNGTQLFGYFLNGYNDSPYGGFFAAHYNTPKYIGIQGGTFTEQTILTNTNYSTTLDGRYVNITGDTMTGLLKINTNSNTVTIGSQNNGFCHIYNSANIPFIFNNNLHITQGKTIGAAGSQYRPFQLYLGYNTTADSRALNSNNPLIEFSNSSRGQYAQIIYTDYNSQGGSDSFTFVSNQSDLRIYAPKVYGAVWNDYAEYRETKEEIEPGRCVREVGDDTLELTTERLQKGCEIVSDTFGFAIGESETAKTPTAASGRVLAYLYEDREIARQHIGDPVCSGPNGTVSIMTEEEEMRYPSRIIGTISAVPDYEIWHAGADGKLEIKVNGRIWIRIR